MISEEVLEAMDEDELFEYLNSEELKSGEHGDQLRDDFEILEVVDIIMVPVLRCKIGAKERKRFLDPIALANGEVCAHEFLIAKDGLIGNIWNAGKAGIKRGSSLLGKFGKRALSWLESKLVLPF